MIGAVFEISSLHYAYTGAASAHALCPAQRKEALCGITLAIPHGIRLALVGANGSGKSTLLMQLNGSLQPTSGEVRFEGKPLDYSRSGLLKLRRSVGMVFQNPDDQLFAGTLAQDVSFGPLNLGLATHEVSDRVHEAIEKVGLAGLGELPLHMLSHGQRQRAALAGVLAMRPQVLLLDEPTAGLDPAGVAALIAQLNILHSSGMTIVIATHDPTLTSRWADRVVSLHEGRLDLQDS